MLRVCRLLLVVAVLIGPIEALHVTGSPSVGQNQYAELVDAARTHLRQGRLEEALKLTAQAIAVDGTSWQAYAVAGTAEAALGRSDDALRSFSLARRFAPENVRPIIDQMISDARVPSNTATAAIPPAPSKSVADTNTRLAGLKTPRTVLTVHKGDDRPFCDFASEGSLVCVLEEQIAVISTLSGRTLSSFPLLEQQHGRVQDMAASETGLLALRFGSDLQVIEASGGRTVRWIKNWDAGAIKRPEEYFRKPGTLAFSPDGKRLAAIRDSSVFLFDVARGTRLGKLDNTEVFTTLAFSPDGSTVAVGAEDQTIRLLDTTWKVRGTLEGHREAIRSVDWVDTATVVSIDVGGGLVTWDSVQGRKEIDRAITKEDHPGHVYVDPGFVVMGILAVASPTQAEILTATGTNRLPGEQVPWTSVPWFTIWDRASLTPKARWHMEDTIVHEVLWTRSGNHLALVLGDLMGGGGRVLLYTLK